MSLSQKGNLDMPAVKVTLRIKTFNELIPGEFIDGHPLRRWRINITMMNERDEEVDADIIENCFYHLHPTFVDPVRKASKPLFQVDEVGWGEFHYRIRCELKYDCGLVIIENDLLFGYQEYATDFAISVPSDNTEMFAILAKNFTVPKIPKNVLIDKQFVTQMIKKLNQLTLENEDVLQEFVDIILNHPAVRDHVSKFSRFDDMLMDISQLPDALLIKLSDYLSNFV